MSVCIEGKNIGINSPPFIIAEMSGNHNQSLERALKLVEVAAECGADAIKLQTYTADTMTLDVRGGSFEIEDKKSLWKGENLHQLFSKAYTPWEWHESIFKKAKEHGIICFSSPFDETAVDFLESLNAPAFKIASFENNHTPLIRKAASKGKPIIISTGMADVGEISKAVKIVNSYTDQLILLKCTSNYPSQPTNANIRTIPHMKNLFKCEVGLSDHTMGLGVPVASISLGATVIEKHFTLDRSEGGVDAEFSMEPKELRELVIESKRAWQAQGNIIYGPTKDEERSCIYRRSIYISSDIKKGEFFNEDNIRIIRPGDGASPEFYDFIIGSKANKNLKKGNPLSLKDIFS